MSGPGYFVLGQDNPLGSMRLAVDVDQSVGAAAGFPGIFMAAGPTRAPSEPPAPARPASQTETMGTPHGWDRPSVWWQTALYAALLAAVLASRYLQFSNGGVKGQFFTTAFLLRDAIAALTAFPIVYAKFQLRTDQPILVQLGLVFTAGMGWQHLIFSLPG